MLRLHAPHARDFTFGWAGFVMVMLLCVGSVALGAGFFLGAIEDWGTENMVLAITLNGVFGTMFSVAGLGGLFRTFFYSAD